MAVAMRPPDFEVSTAPIIEQTWEQPPSEDRSAPMRNSFPPTFTTQAANLPFASRVISAVHPDAEAEAENKAVVEISVAITAYAIFLKRSMPLYLHEGCRFYVF